MSKVVEGEEYIKKGSSLHLELNEKGSSVRISVANDNYSKLTIVPLQNVSCLVYSDEADKLAK
jgi:hypothetical protein